MKKLLFVLVFAWTCIATFGQRKEVTSCWNYLKYGELDKAKESIEKAILHETTMNEYKTWWYRGNTYLAIQTTKEAKYKDMDPDAAEKSYKSYLKALALNFKETQNQTLNLEKKEDLEKFFKLLMDKNTKYLDDECLQDIIGVRLPPLANVFVNKGVADYKDKKDYCKALQNFENSLRLSGLALRIDTPIIYYAALAAEKCNKCDRAVEFYSKLILLKYGADKKEKSNMYFYLASAYKCNKDTVKYVESLKKGISSYPNDCQNVIAELINYYLQSNKSKEALDYLNIAIEKSPNNATYYFAKGALLEGTKEWEKSEECYSKAIEIDPNYLDANYNLGALHYNRAADIANEANNEQDQKKYETLKAKSDDEFKKALPYMEKAHQLDPKDMNVISTLKTIYYKLQMTDKYEEMKKKLGK